METPPVAPVPGSGEFHPKVVVVTGATSGIGRAAAVALRSRVGTLVLLGRSPEKLAIVARTLDATPGNGPVRTHVADLSRMAEVRRVAAELAASYPEISVLVNNAGAYFSRIETTDEGVERTFALNVLAPYLLTRILRAPLRSGAPSRVVNVASAAHTGARLHLDDLEMRRRYRGFEAYRRSKLELILLTHEFARRWESDGIRVNALHPGFVRSGYGMNNPGLVRGTIRFLGALFGEAPEKGAETPVYLATSPQVEGSTGEYFARRRAVRSSPASYDVEGAKRLWELCATRVGLTESDEG